MKRSRVMSHVPVLSGAHWFVSRYRAQPFPNIAGTWSAGSPSRHFHQTVGRSPPDRPVGQISPDKNVNFHDATAAFTVSPEPGALSCRADLPGDSALYAVSVRRLIRFALRLPSDGPSRFRPCLRLVLMQMSKRTPAGFTYRGLSPHKFTPMPGVHVSFHRTARDRVLPSLKSLGARPVKLLFGRYHNYPASQTLPSQLYTEEKSSEMCYSM